MPSGIFEMLLYLVVKRFDIEVEAEGGRMENPKM